jgi:glycosyltransferase involved in cell wall biosynthesis
MTHLSIVIPAYNEANRIGKTLEETLRFLDARIHESEIIVVNDGSRDRTAEIVREYQPKSAKTALRLIENPGNRGKGYSVRNGMLHAEGEIVLFMDADLATPLTEVEKVIGPIGEGRYDVVFGSRALDRSLIGTHQSGLRETIGKAGNLIQFLLTGLRFKDTQCGFKAFRHSAAQAVFRLQQVDGFGFDPEILFIARKQGWRMLELPVRWNHVEGSKLNPLLTPIKVLLEVMTIRWNDLSGKYENKAKISEKSIGTTE